MLLPIPGYASIWEIGPGSSSLSLCSLESKSYPRPKIERVPGTSFHVPDKRSSSLFLPNQVKIKRELTTQSTSNCCPSPYLYSPKVGLGKGKTPMGPEGHSTYYNDFCFFNLHNLSNLYVTNEKARTLPAHVLFLRRGSCMSAVLCEWRFISNGHIKIYVELSAPPQQKNHYINCWAVFTYQSICYGCILPIENTTHFLN